MADLPQSQDSLQVRRRCPERNNNAEEGAKSESVNFEKSENTKLRNERCSLLLSYHRVIAISFLLTASVIVGVIYWNRPYSVRFVSSTPIYNDSQSDDSETLVEKMLTNLELPGNYRVRRENGRENYQLDFENALDRDDALSKFQAMLGNQSHPMHAAFRSVENKYWREQCRLGYEGQKCDTCAEGFCGPLCLSCSKDSLAKKTTKYNTEPTNLNNCGPGNAVSLTFDDTPHHEATPKLLKDLEAFNIKAAFFVQPKPNEEKPDEKKSCDILKSIAAAGHDIMAHTWTHPYMDDFVLQNGIRPLEEEIDHAEQWVRNCLQDAFDEETYRQLRPPFGAVSHMVTLMLNHKGYGTTMWTCDSYQLKKKDGLNLEERMESLRRGIRKGESPIVLLHDRDFEEGLINATVSMFAKEGYTEFISQRECIRRCQMSNSCIKDDIWQGKKLRLPSSMRGAK